MKKRVALVGHCGPDSSFLTMTLGAVSRQVEVLSADDDASLQRLLREGVDLLLFNRVLDFGFDETEGVAVIRKLHAHDPNLKMMLISNYPEAQVAAVEAGALPGFGKREMGSKKVKEMLSRVIDAQPAQTTPTRS